MTRREHGLIVRDSFALPYGNGMIWYEALDGLGNELALVREKFDREMKQVARPSTTSHVVLHVEGTALDEALMAHMAAGLLALGHGLKRLAVVGLSWWQRLRMRRAMIAVARSVAVGYFSDLEKGKEWLMQGHSPQ